MNDKLPSKLKIKCIFCTQVPETLNISGGTFINAEQQCCLEYSYAGTFMVVSAYAAAKLGET